jgi:hypothetical protein
MAQNRERRTGIASMRAASILDFPLEAPVTRGTMFGEAMMLATLMSARRKEDAS